MKLRWVLGLMAGLALVAAQAGLAGETAVKDNGSQKAQRPPTAQPKADAKPAAVRTPKKAAAPRKSVSPASQPTPSEADLRRALEQPIQVEFVETPLSDVVPFLKDSLHVQIMLDHKALNDVGVAPDTPITISVHGRAANVLGLLLRDLDLTWAIHNGVLLITTPEQAASMLRATVYDVRDLVLARDEKGRPANDFDQLIDTITSAVEPTTWDSVGGPGSISPFENEGIAVIVISQTDGIHEQIEKLLADLRKARSTQPGEPTVRRIYRPKPATPQASPPGKPSPNQLTPCPQQPGQPGGAAGGAGGGGMGMF